MKTVYAMPVLLCFSLLASAQGEQLRALADDWFLKNHFAAAAPYYMELLKADPNNPTLNYKLGVCYMHSRSQKAKAVDCFEKAAIATAVMRSENEKNETPSNNTDLAPVATYKLLADAYHHTYRFDEAIATYEKYKKLLLESKAVDTFLVEEADRQIELCRMGKELKELKEQVASLISRKYKRAESNGNAPMQLLTANEKSDGRAINTLVKWDDERQFFEETDIPDKKAALYNAADTQHVFNEASVATSVDGQVILIYRNEKGEANLYASTLVGNNWTYPEPVCRTYNKKGWETNECISADGSVMYFTSAREGGYGGTDIYRCERLPGGEWSKAVNMGPGINTPFDEQAPFIHPDGRTLYFSSNRGGGPNRFDIYAAVSGDSTFGPAKNIGYPMQNNTNEKKNSVELPEDKRNCTVSCRNSNQEELVLLRGKVSDKENKELKNAEITITDNETGKIAAIYNPMPGGRYLLLLPSNRNLNITYEAEGYLFHSENLDTRNDTSLYRLYPAIELLPLQSGSRIALPNIFFETGKPTLKPSSAAELDNIYRLLHRNNNLSVEIACNMNEGEVPGLSQARADAIVKYMYDRGIKKEKLTAKSRSGEKNTKKRKRKKETHYDLELKIVETK